MSDNDDAPSNIIPLFAEAKSPAALLHEIAEKEGENLHGLVLVTFRKDGNIGYVQMNLKRRDLAFAGELVSAHVFQGAEL